MTISVFFGAAALLSFCAAACSDGGAASGGDGLRRVAYVSSDEAFPNPERGFYYPYDFRFAGAERRNRSLRRPCGDSGA